MTLLTGHGLRAEGAAFSKDGVRLRWNTTAGPGCGMCSCGAVSESLPTGSARRQWHRQHKRQVAVVLGDPSR